MRLLIATAEASGDALGRALLDALIAQGAAPQALAVAGTQLADGPVTVLARAERATAFGLFEVARSLPALARHRSCLRAQIRTAPPDLLLTIDSPGLHLSLARFARARGVPVVHAVCPQFWASRPWRVRRLADAVDHVLCLLPFEPDLLAAHGVPSTFIGHPRAWPERGAPPADPPRIVIAPGSRPGELRAHLPAVRATVSHLRRRRPAARILVLRAPTVAAEALRDLGDEIVDDVRDVEAHVALAASGTLTVELAALGIPQVVFYRVHPLTYPIARALIRVPNIALPSVLAGRAIVPEHIQHLDPAALAEDVLRLLGPDGDLQRQLTQRAIAPLRQPDGLDRAAQILSRVASRRVGGAAPRAR